MPHVTRLINKRQRRLAHRQRNPLGKAGFVTVLVLSLLLAISPIFFASFYANLTKDLPSLQAIPSLLEPPGGMFLQSTQILDRSGKHLIAELQNPAIKERRFLGLPSGFNQPSGQFDTNDFFPATLILTTLASKEPGFWQNIGCNLVNIFQSGVHGITGQLVQDLLLWQETPGLRRDARACILSLQLTRQYGKEQILTWYLNSAKYGPMIYGADSAVQVYFNKPTASINLLEAAAIAISAEAPSINPHSTPNLIRARAVELLEQMYSSDWITQDEWLQFKDAPLIFSEPQSSTTFAPAFVQLVIEQLSQYINLDTIERGGLKITTSLDYDLQVQSICTLNTQFYRLYQNYSALETIEGIDCKAALLLPTLPRVPSEPPSDLTASLVIIHPSTAEVLALSDIATKSVISNTPQIDIHQTSSLQTHPAGTIITPFIYLTGLTRGYSPASLLWDIPTPTSSLTQTQDLSSYNGPVRLRIAMTNDYLTPAAKILQQVGVENVQKISDQVGLSLADSLTDTQELEERQLSKILDETEMTLIDLSQAYNILANSGTQVGFENSLPGENHRTLQPNTILSVDYSGSSSWIPATNNLDIVQPISKPVLSLQLAYLLNNMLSDEPARRPSLGHPNPLEIGHPAAAKTGITTSGDNLWTIGYTPHLLVGVWMGHSETIPQNKIPINAITGVWHSLMQYAGQEHPADNWQAPSGVTAMDVCDPSGMLPGENCPNIVRELFLNENIPNQVDSLYQRISVNRQTGLLATIFTPQEFIENRLYLVVPPEASEWAAANNILIPPNTYDVIQQDLSSIDTNAQISSPQMFQFVRGDVKLLGTARSDDFDYYRITTGKGLYPQEWLDIGIYSEAPQLDGLLGVWNTNDINGLYTLQLMVVQKDQQIRTSFIQVTVDNIPPEIASSYPAADDIVTPINGHITLLTQVTDNLGIQNITYYIDGKHLATINNYPYTYPWVATPGDHQLKITVTDLAGNSIEKVNLFIVK